MRKVMDNSRQFAMIIIGCLRREMMDYCGDVRQKLKCPAS
jgi:hypothetical protein